MLLRHTTKPVAFRQLPHLGMQSRWKTTRLGNPSHIGDANFKYLSI